MSTVLVGAPLACVALAACTALLGDFTVGSGTTGGDGGLDATAGNDGGAGDGGGATDGDGSAYARVQCSETRGSRVKLDTIARSSSNTNGPDRVWALPSPTAARPTRLRVVVPDDQGSVRTYTIDSSSNGGASTPITLSISGQILSVRRYATGIAMLAYRTGIVSPAGTTDVAMYTLADGDATWSSAFEVADETALGGARVCLTRLGGAFAVVDASSNDYLVVLSSVQAAMTGLGSCNSGAAGTTALVAAHVAGKAPAYTAWTTPSAAAGGMDLAEEAIVVTPSAVDVFATPSSGSGAASGAPPVLYETTLAMGATSPRTISPKVSSDFLEFTGARLAASGTDVDLAFLEGDPNSATLSPVFYVGSAPAKTFSSLKPSDVLPATALTTTADLPVDKSHTRWQSFTAPASENFVAIARVLNQTTGANMIWWDGQGRVRAQQTAGEDASVIPDAVVVGVDVTFVGTPRTSLTEMQVAWTDATAGGTSPYVVWTTQLSCIAQ